MVGMNSDVTQRLQNADNVISTEGVTFNVRYIGCIEIKTSMKLLDFQSRSQLAKECINRLCVKAGLKSSKKQSADKIILQAIADSPNMSKAGTNAILRLSTKCLSVVGYDNNETMANYDMPRISFASGGDLDTVNFVAFVAKNLQDYRTCYVLECGNKAIELIAAIKQAFDLRCKEFLSKQHLNIDASTEKDYYNDLPGKRPPKNLNLDSADEVSGKQSNQKDLTIAKPRGRFGSNLIDLNSPPPDYVNDKCFDIDSCPTPCDVFDVQPLSLSAEGQRSQLLTERWFHASMNRQAAEALLKHDGDFLVRESQGKPGQYVLTGLQALNSRHLLLTTDQNGTVRTKDRLFDSISHLINYHWTNALPITFEQSALVLRNPVSLE